MVVESEVESRSVIRNAKIARGLGRDRLRDGGGK